MERFARAIINLLCDLYAKAGRDNHGLKSEASARESLPRAAACFAAQIVTAAGSADEFPFGDDELAA